MLVGFLMVEWIGIVCELECELFGCIVVFNDYWC